MCASPRAPPVAALRPMQRRARCPAHRPGYMCTSPTYHRYDRGAFSVDCSWPGFSLDAFSKDHQQAGGAGAQVSAGGQIGCQERWLPACRACKPA